MAALQSPTNPSYVFSNPHSKLSNHAPNSPLIPTKSFFFPNGSGDFPLGFTSRSWKQSIVVKSSKQTEIFVESTQPSGMPLLSCSEVIERLRKDQKGRKSKQQYVAMYSSVVGGVITDPAAMVIPMDDHMVHRGHGVFDTAAIVEGYLYELDQHLNRFLSSAGMAKIKLPFDREKIRETLIQTVSASKCRNGSLRYWLSAGPGDFELLSSDCHQTALYAIVIQNQSPFDFSPVKVVTSSIPIKPPQFSVMKCVDYLPNALSKLEAEENGAYAGIWLDEDGFVAEGSNMNVAFITKEKELLMPQFDKILGGWTAKRVLDFARDLVKEGKLSRACIRNVTMEEGKEADEMMLMSSGVIVRSVVQWDEQIFGNGTEGPLTKTIRKLIIEDMKSGPPSVRVPVPY